jgi:hypothetical protein
MISAITTSAPKLVTTTAQVGGGQQQVDQQAVGFHLRMAMPG